jgi:hypothetical protein
MAVRAGRKKEGLSGALQGLWQRFAAPGGPMGNDIKLRMRPSLLRLKSRADVTKSAYADDVSNPRRRVLSRQTPILMGGQMGKPLHLMPLSQGFSYTLSKRHERDKA